MSILNELKTEIIRVSRREINKELATVKRVNATQRTLIANLRKEVNALQKQVKRLEKTVPVEKVIEAEEQDERKGFWITGQGVKSLRKKLGITQVQLAKLSGVSDQAVANWEKTKGKIRFRKEGAEQKLQQLRSCGKRKVQEMLGE
jgi:DNA-binding transcriptional regulator YiaG